MKQPFLTAEWKNLIIANYAIDPAILAQYLPFKTELDDFNGKHFVSLVGFLFKNTRLKGFSVPFHSTFEEVNLRFYVRYKTENNWKRGVVFIKEIVPKRFISLVANTWYNENYITLPMSHRWELSNPKEIDIEYRWQWKKNWNYLKAKAKKEILSIQPGSIEEFITEHYWGYTSINKEKTSEYEVCHPSWQYYPIIDYDTFCTINELYGAAFVETMQTRPHSVILAKGSDITVMNNQLIF